MRKTILFALILLLLFPVSGFLSFPPQDYEELWKKVYDFKADGLPRSALEVVDEIYQEAKTDENQPQLLKALIYRISLHSQFEEEPVADAIYFFQKELDQSDPPVRQVLHSLLAELYQWYYEQNRWKVNERGVLMEPDEQDLETWDAVRLNKAIRNHYMASLEEADYLKQVNLKPFAPILVNNDRENFTLYPTLYDLLANRALIYLSGYDAGLFDFREKIPITDLDFLAPANRFIDLQIPEGESHSKELLIYQHLTRLHLQDKQQEALVDLDLRRLEYVFNNSLGEEPQREAYINALRYLAENNIDNELFVKVSAQLAKLYVSEGRGYQPADSPEHRYSLVEAAVICEEALSRFPAAEQAPACRNILDDIKKEEHSFQLETAELPGREIPVLVRFRNIKKLFMKIVRLDDPEAMHDFRQVDKDSLQRWMQKKVQTLEFEFPDTKDHQQHATEVALPPLTTGTYAIFASSDASFSEEQHIAYQFTRVTDLAYVTRNDQRAGGLEVFVLDRETGQAVRDARVTAFEFVYNAAIRRQEMKKIGETLTDEEGFAKMDVLDQDRQKHIVFTVRKGDDFLPSSNGEYLRRQNREDALKTKTYLFTDRSIYRPGQIVYFKGLVIERNSKELRLRKEFTSEVELLDVNRKSIGTIELTTNDYGTYQGQFVLPTGLLNGMMTLKTASGSVQIAVEEYKRPTFLVEFDTLKGAFKQGDSIPVTGKAVTFSGVPLDGATVKYKVVEHTFIVPYWRGYMPFPRDKEITIAHGKTETENDGSFRIVFPTPDGPETSAGYHRSRVYTLHADVTDRTGEVQSGITKVSVGREAVLLRLESEQVIMQEKHSPVTLSAVNASGSKLDIDVKVKVYRLTPPERLLHARYWEKPDMPLMDEETFKKDFPHLPYRDEDRMDNWPRTLVFTREQPIQGEAAILDDFLASADQGGYLIEALSIGSGGDTARTEKYVTLYSIESNRLPGNMIDWSSVDRKIAEPGDIVTLSLGSAARRSRIYYEVVVGEKTVSREWVDVGKNMTRISIPVEESFRGGFEVRTLLVRFNRIYLDAHHIEVPFSNKRLNLKLETRRDYLTPGNRENWTVRVTGPGGEQAAAEMLAAMYDASLDQFRPHQWGLDLYPPHRTGIRLQTGFFNSATSRYLTYRHQDYLDVKTERYPQINWFGFRNYGYGNLRGGVTDLKMAGNTMDAPAETVEKESQNQEMVADSSEAVDAQDMEQPDKKEMVVRRDFRETAFFYPQLTTDSTGNLSFTFTTPDALTEWKLMLLAHDKELKVGNLVEHFKARKELMIMPNLPRFVRQGDRIVFTAKLINMTKQALIAGVMIAFSDPVTGKSLEIFSAGTEAESEVHLGPEESRLLEWEIIIPGDISMLGYRIEASSENHMDAEERMIPVLTNRILVTETLPMHLGSEAQKTFTFKGLSDQTGTTESTIRNERLTVEFTSNPAWYAIQSLPYLEESPRENSMGIFHRLYANLLAAFIVRQNPAVQAVFDSWKTASPDEFLSNLEKNESLKNLVLEATPWVLEAQDETEQKRRIALLFDVNRLALEEQSSLEKLKASQLSNGGWPWFKGMEDDRHVTRQIVTGFARLAEKQVIDMEEEQEIHRILNRAVRYLDEEMLSKYEKLKKNNKNSMDKDQLGSEEIGYLYARSLLRSQYSIPHENGEAFDYYVGQEQKYWLNKSNYLQSMIALTLAKLGMRDEAEGIRRSLNERALQDEEMGMYWRQQSGWYWYEAPIESQAMAIEVFATIGNDRKAVEKMKIWLLKQKQTTRWVNTSATAEAVFALLFNGNDLLSETNPVEVKVGGHTLEAGNSGQAPATAGTGYFTRSWHGSEISPEMGTITAKNPNTGVSWGAAYWQYFEDLDKVSAAKTPLSINKSLWKERMTDDGPILEALQDGDKLDIGDKLVVRLTIATDRTMDYVHVRDMRASALEPSDQLSGYTYGGGLWYYRQVKDASTDFFIRTLLKGTYILEYPLKVTQRGTFANGIASIQCLYAPEFAAHSAATELIID